MSAPGPIELDDRATWPEALRQATAAIVQEGTAEDSEVIFGGDPWVQAVDEAVLRGYHCTRLTEAERTAVLASGLEALSGDLVARRIRQALEERHLDRAVAERLLVEHLAVGPERGATRLGQVCLVGNRAHLSEEAGVWRLLTFWGGEAISMAYGDDDPEMATIRGIGTPSVVQVRIDLKRDDLRCYPPVVVAAAQLEIGDYGGGSDVFCMHSLGPDRIEAIHQPGSDFWDRCVGHSTE